MEVDGERGASAESGVQIELELDSSVNFAMQQNDVPVVKALRVHNGSGCDLGQLLVRLTTQPAFAEPLDIRVAALAAGSTHSPAAVNLKLSPSYLLELTERVSGRLQAEVLEGQNVLARHTSPIDVLAYDEWSGLRSLPEILAAFVTPNHPAIEQLLASAASVLCEWTGQKSLSGYQTKDRQYVARMAAAVFAAVQKAGISYINPPASFEFEGQKIRLPDRVLDNRLGTCLDLSVLMAACLEQCGLNPLVVLLDGHALPGVWLDDESFSESAMDDGLRLRKRVDLGEICVFESTLVCQASAVSFDQALEAGRRKLDELEEFRCAIDIRRARKSRIRPLPLRAGGKLVARLEQAPETEPAQASLPELSMLIEPAQDTAVGAVDASGATDTPATRLEKWKRKLLDLSLRNRLLNFRESKKTLHVLCPDLGLLEDALAEGDTFQVHPRPRELDAAAPRSAELHTQRTGDDIVRELLLEEFKSRRLHADLSQTEVERRTLEIFREARSSLEEGGANILYLALGFLQWYESPSSQQARLAPIILIPLELERRSVQEGFRIRQGDDEPRINTTLLELLAQDFDLNIAGMDPLPQDEHGLNVHGILTTFRQSIKNIDRWDVVEQAQIGLFSFTKFLMWRDLRERVEDLLKNEVVKHLVETPTEAFADQGPFPEPAELDTKYKPDETFCPVSCDSSQLAGVYAAAEEKSFVLDGPPGTGKSQTITNIISHALATGRTVLFVSEKMAALNVVHSRLQRVGLGPYCLELHSSKAHKSEVIAQLGEALEQTSRADSEAWKAEAKRLQSLREELNAYVEALHQKHASGESLFQGLSKLIGVREAPKLPLKWESPEAIGKEQLEGLRDLVQQIQTAGQACGDPLTNPWKAAGAEEWGPAFQKDVEALLEALSGRCQELERVAAPLASLLGFAGSQWSCAGFGFVEELAALFTSPPPVSMAMLTDSDFDRVKQTACDWSGSLARRNELRRQLFPRYSQGMLEMDHALVRRQLQEGEAKWFVPRWFSRRAVLRQLQLVSSQPQKLDARQMLQDIDAAATLKEIEAHLGEHAEKSRQLLGPLWSQETLEETALNASLEWAERFRSLVSRVAGSGAAQGGEQGFESTWARLACEQHAQLQAGGEAARTVALFREAWQAFCAARQGVEQKLRVERALAWPESGQAPLLATVRGIVSGWKANMNALRPWCSWRKVRSQALGQNLGALVEAYEEGKVSCAALRTVFDRSYYEWWCDAVIEARPLLRNFFSPEFERRIQQFREVDERYTSLTRDEIRARLAAKVPSASTQVNSKSEMGILRNLLQQKRPRMSIRTLLQKIPNLVHRLKPCMLMSPISVAQYLDAAHPPFDLVVFDEASQIPAWDAVGAIARGRKAIIAGDPKQLPPTSFFSRAEAEEEEQEEALQDLESVLDDCIAAQLPRCRLKWHYRSRHESLIAFSNRQYYEGRLLTFASPERRMAVSFREVQGVYDKAGARTNRAEAEAVVEEIVGRLLDPERQNSSIGVVTFSMAQQSLVEDLLDERRRQTPQIEPFFGGEADEPVFVKNLENVQGDERDVILFSICYGPDANRRVSMNFGPLNREGGERRLNVAITRARQEIVVFSTLKAEHIDLAKTRARGVRDLKLFLDYAARGQAAMNEFAAASPDAAFESPFEKQIAQELEKLGYEVHSQVGCSGYRIDLAVVDPQAPGRYLIGIECDGANYHSAKTARDRDRLRQSVLQDLGWHLHRVWSSDWWMDPQAEVAKISAAIEQAKEQRNQPVKAEEPKRFASAPIMEQTPPPLKSEAAPKPRAAEDHHTLYSAYACAPRGTADSFYERSSEKLIRKLIEEIADCEAPISLGLLAKRVAGLWGIQRVTSNVLDRVLALAASAAVKVVDSQERQFVWKCDENPEEYEQFRVVGESEESKRDARDICPEEVAAGVRHILAEQGNMPQADLVRETARLFGFQRVGQNVERYMQAGITLIRERQAVAD